MRPQSPQAVAASIFTHKMAEKFVCDAIR